MALFLLFMFFFVQQASCLVPPKFQWKTLDYKWENNRTRDDAIRRGDYIPENNMPTGLAIWKNKLFITIPRIKQGVPSSLNYIYLNGTQDQALNPYPSWDEGFLPQEARSAPRNSTVVCALRAFVDCCDRLWTVDNGVVDITDQIKQIADPAILVYDLHTDRLLHKFVLQDNVLRDASVFTSIVVDYPCRCTDNPNATFAYITDMGSSAIVVFNLKNKEAWRIENDHFHFDPHAGLYKVGGLEFYWSDGISSATLTKQNKRGFRNLYFHPTSSTKQFVVSTKLLRNKTATEKDISDGVQIVGDRGTMSQSTACAYENNVLFYTQLNKNGLACWNTEKPFTKENNPVIFSDCNLMEFPSDIKMDDKGNLWMLSNRHSRFLYGDFDVNQVNFRILSAPAAELTRGTACEKLSSLSKVITCMRPKSSGNKPSEGMHCKQLP